MEKVLFAKNFQNGVNNKIKLKFKFPKMWKHTAFFILQLWPRSSLKIYRKFSSISGSGLMFASLRKFLRNCICESYSA